MNIYIGILIVFIILLVIRYAINSYKIKGAIGESRVSHQLNELKEYDYEVLNDILIKTDTGSSQIDHIVISKIGIFVIESKNYSGWIFGNENSEFWTQSFSSHRTKFRNPIKQNWAHIYTLKKALSDFGQITYYPLIVFSGGAELKNIVSHIPVIYVHQLMQTIIDQQGVPNLSIEQVRNIAEKLRSANIQDPVAKKEHIEQVHEHTVERELKEKALICPRCSGNLVIREGPYGKFYGCSNYPKCRYSSNMNEYNGNA
jgi:hypothetical protein